MNEQNEKWVVINLDELLKIADWAKSELLLQAPLVRIETKHAAGIGQAVTAVALDRNANPVAELDATDYGSW